MNTTRHTEILFQAHYHQKVWKRMKTNDLFSQGEILDYFNEISFAIPLNISVIEKILGKKFIVRIMYKE